MDAGASRLIQKARHLVGARRDLPPVVDLFGAQLIPLVVMVSLNFFTARVLGPDGKGRASFVVLSASLGATGLFLSLHTGAIKAHRSDDQTGPARGLMMSAAIAMVPLAAGAATITFHLHVGPSFLRPADAALLLVGLAASVPTLYVLRTIQGLGLAKPYRDLAVRQAAAYALVVAMFLPFGLTPTLTVVAWLVAQLVSLAGGLRVLSRQVNLRRIRPAHQAVFRPSAVAHVGNVGHQIMYRTDVILVGFIGTAANVGIYTVATSLAEVVVLVAEAFSLAVFAEGAALRVQTERRTRLERQLYVYRRVGAVVAFALLGIGWVLFHGALAGYERSFPVLVVLLPGVWLGGEARIRLSSLIAASSQSQILMTGAASAFSSLLYIPMIRTFGLAGAAITSSSLYGFQALFLRRMMRELPR